MSERFKTAPNLPIHPTQTPHLVLVSKLYRHLHLYLDRALGHTHTLQLLATRGDLAVGVVGVVKDLVNRTPILHLLAARGGLAVGVVR